MTPFFETSGHLTEGFQGHIAFHMHLREPRASLRIMLELIAPKPAELHIASSEPARPRHMADKKNEVHVEAYLDGQFIGGLHKHRDTRALWWTPDDCGEGCLMHPEPFSGMLTIQLLVFNILADGLDYRVTA